MNIGILTFHWATNYGAVLQCYALQEYLCKLGHDVEVIDYKPHRYDDNAYTFLCFRKFLNIREYLNSRKKEAALKEFRSHHLHLTNRIYSCKDMISIANRYDVIISGSDQVVNPSFLMSGEGRGIITPTYFLGFPFNGRRIGYALSFGCVTYPENARKIASGYIKDFDVITVREKTGVDIMRSMGRDDAVVVPDPTLLMEPWFYHTLEDKCEKQQHVPYVYSFFIRHIAERKTAIDTLLKDKLVLWNNEDGDYTMQGWLSKIKHAEFIVTDSFHCMIMCLKLHRPFAVVTEEEGNVGMNDRLYTLLANMGMSNHIVYKEHFAQIITLLDEKIDWAKIDNEISQGVHSVIDILK